MTRTLLPLFLLLYLAPLVAGQQRTASPQVKPLAPLEFNRDIRPILSDACFHCHGPDRSKRKGGLRLDTEEGRSSLVPGKPDESELIARIISAEEKHRMPPAKSGRALTADQVKLLRRWIAEGATWSPHWAYLPPRRPALEPTEIAGSGTNPIDTLVRGRLAREGLSPAPEAPRHTLIRRATLDLTGLPPTPEEVDAFLRDHRPDAYARLVDRLLASPRFGERMAADWLDSARYADSNGYQSDRDRVMWPWRDWVVRALNANMPFDRFTLEQIAGDLLPGATLEQRLATGFHRNHPLNGEGGRIAEESRIDYVMDRVETTGTVWLGVTIGCARCHDHKYDPFTTKDYYRLFAYFNNVPESGAVDRGGNAAPVLELPTEEQSRTKARLLEQARQLERKRDRAPARVKGSVEKDLKKKQEEISALSRKFLSVMVMEERPSPRDSHVLLRGAWDKPGEKVTAGVPEWLKAIPQGARKDRLGLAQWLIEPSHPMTARVIVNRFWQQLFGAGLVRTAEDFGVQGSPPVHPEVLDWLAAEFVESGWDVKRLLKRILTSATYRQSSVVTASLLERDPDNRLLARGPRYRLPSAMIRDQALAISGLLVERIGGPPVKPYQPPGLWEEFSFGYIRYQQGKGTDLHRRSLYTFWRRTVGPPNLFDAAARQVCEVKPTRTNTPLHALVTLNDVTFTEAARVLAARVMREGGRTPAERLAWAFRLVTARPPASRELEILIRGHERLRARYGNDREQATRLISVGESPVDQTADVVDLAAYAGVCGLLLNLDEVLTKE